MLFLRTSKLSIRISVVSVFSLKNALQIWHEVNMAKQSAKINFNNKRLNSYSCKSSTLVHYPLNSTP